MRRVAAIFVILLALAPSARAGGDTAAEIAREVMSPFCPGVTLHDCPSAAADELRRRIDVWVDAGWSRDRIMNELAAEYGEDIRAVPPAEGSGLLAWVLPGAALVAGGAGAWYLLRRWTTKNTRDEPSIAIPLGDKKRIDAELDALRGEL